ncbi:MAG: MBL fold metallo-hydrolase [Candidatus Parcubacteria bacterium]|nr:MBL fold metallo-hydrolase [Candidatus Parcubacteria bacterium]
MQITFLGTGPMEPIPRPGHQDSICQDARKFKSKSKRTRSSVVLNYKNFNLLIDASPDFLKQVKQNKIKKIDAVLVTHPHFDAYGGITQLNAWLKSPIPIYCQKQTWLIIKKRFKNLPNLKYKEIVPYKKFIVNNFPPKADPPRAEIILPLPVQHSIINERKFPTLAFKIKNLIYCSDVKTIPAKSLGYFKNIQNLILDAAMYFNKQIFSHLNTADAILLAKKLKIKKLYLTQIGHSYPPYKTAQKEIQRFVRQNKIKTNVYLAFDKMKIKL